MKQIYAQTAKNTCSLLSKHVNSTMKSGSTSESLHQWLQRNETIDFATKVQWKNGSYIGQLTVLWTASLKIGNFFVNYGFGTQWEDETVHIPKHQKAHILNLDKSSLIIDGTMQQRGVHLSASSYDKLIPVLGMIAWTISQSSTLIIGSTATGEVLPPLFQFSTEADHEYIHLKTLWFIKNIGGKVLTWWGEIVSLHFWIAW